MSVRIDEDVDTFVDARGTSFVPVASEALASMRNVHVVLTEPGQVRGNHRHFRGDEQITVCGPALARWREGDDLHEREIPEGTVRRFTFGPGVAHAFKNTGTRTMVLVSFGTVAFDPANTERVPRF